MTKIMRIDEMCKTSNKINESFGNDSYLDFFATCLKVYGSDTKAFDELCPDLDYGEDELYSALIEIGIDNPEDIGHAYFKSIFDTYINNLVEEGKIKEEEVENFEISFNPIEFKYDNEYFKTTKELMYIITGKRAEHFTKQS